MANIIVTTLITLTVLFANTASSLAQETAPKPTNEYPFQCGAAYWLISKVYAEGKQPTKVAQYRSKFDKLSAKAEADFLALNRTKDDATAYMTQHVQDLINLADQGNSRVVVNFAKRCDELFPV